MRFAYTYRSSDGQRHAAEIEAESRDAAFAKVRAELGIKPIRVTAAGDASRQDGGSPYGRNELRPSRSSGGKPQSSILNLKSSIILAAAFLALLAFGAWWWLAWRAENVAAAPRGGKVITPPEGEGGGYRQETRDAFLKLVERAGALEDRCRAELKLLKLDNLHDYAWIARTKDLAPLYRELEKAQSIIDYTRLQAKDLFRDIYSKFPAASANERTDAQRRYGELMVAIDAEEERVQAEHLVLLLLDDHRTAWHVERGSIAFTDAKVKEDFLFYSKPTDGSTARWKKDFGQTGAEKPIKE